MCFVQAAAVVVLAQMELMVLLMVVHQAARAVAVLVI
jgi:hypothetical protein